GPTSSRVIDYRTLEVHPGGRLLAARAADFSVVVLADLSASREVANLQTPRGGFALWEPSGAVVTPMTSCIWPWPIRAALAEPERYGLGPPERLFQGNIVPGAMSASSGDGQTLAIPDLNRGAVVVHRGPPARTVRLQPQQDVRYCAVSPDGR